MTKKPFSVVTESEFKQTMRQVWADADCCAEALRHRRTGQWLTKDKGRGGREDAWTMTLTDAFYHRSKLDDPSAWDIVLVELEPPNRANKV